MYSKLFSFLSSLVILFIIIAPKDKYFEKTISNMQEVIARGGKIFFITDNKKINQTYKWVPNKNIIDVVSDTYKWMLSNKKFLKNSYKI